MITVAELARELNVSVQAIYKKINKSMKDKLRPHITTVDGQKVIDEQGAELIRSSFNSFKPVQGGSEPSLNGSESPNANVPNNGNKSDSTGSEPVLNQKETEALKDSNNAEESVLNQFRTSLNEEIMFLRTQNKELQDALEREREHSRGIAEKLAELTSNSQTLLKREQEKTAFLLLPDASSELNETAQNEKKTFWNRIFRQKK